MHAEGRYRDPYGLHDDRWFSDGRPSDLVRDEGVETRTFSSGVVYLHHRVAR